MRFGPMEIGLILIIVLIAFGAGRLSRAGRATGETMRESRKTKKDEARILGEDQRTPGEEHQSADNCGTSGQI